MLNSVKKCCKVLKSREFLLLVSSRIPRFLNDVTADNQFNAKMVVKQRHPGDEFPVSQRGSTKGKQSTNARV